MARVHKETEFQWIKKNKEIRYGRTEVSRAGWYHTPRWRKLRKYKMSINPLCEICERNNKVTKAVLVDHIVPVDSEDDENFLELFYSLDNLQSLCEKCHIEKTKRDHSKFSEKNLIEGKKLKNKYNDFK